MKRLFSVLLLFAFQFSALAQTPTNTTTSKASLEHAIYLLALANHSMDMDGPFQAITGAPIKTDDGLQITAVKNLKAPDNIKHYLFGEPKKWPNLAAEINSPDACAAMINAITEVLPGEEPKGTYTSQTDNSEAAAGKIKYYLMLSGKKIGSFNYNKNTNTGLLVMAAGY